MPISEGNVLRVTSTIGSNVNTWTGLNVFHYEVINAPDDQSILSLCYENWAEQFRQSVIVPVMVITDGSFKLLSLLVENISNGIDFYNYTTFPPTGGGVAGEVLPPFVAWSFRLNRGSKVTRNGYKRFPFVPESLVIEGLASVPQAQIDAIVSGLSNVVSSISSFPTTGMACKPIIASFNPDGTFRAKQDIASVQFRGVSSQSTRKN